MGCPLYFFFCFCHHSLCKVLAVIKQKKENNPDCKWESINKLKNPDWWNGLITFLAEGYIPPGMKFSLCKQCLFDIQLAFQWQRLERLLSLLNCFCPSSCSLRPPGLWHTLQVPLPPPLPLLIPFHSSGFCSGVNFPGKPSQNSLNEVHLLLVIIKTMTVWNTQNTPETVLITLHKFLFFKHFLVVFTSSIILLYCHINISLKSQGSEEHSISITCVHNLVQLYKPINWA